MQKKEIEDSSRRLPIYNAKRISLSKKYLIKDITKEGQENQYVRLAIRATGRRLGRGGGN